jgi:hypothetical protein
MKEMAKDVLEKFDELTEENKRVVTAYADGLAMGVRISKKEEEGEDKE